MYNFNPFTNSPRTDFYLRPITGTQNKINLVLSLRWSDVTVLLISISFEKTYIVCNLVQDKLIK